VVELLDVRCIKDATDGDSTSLSQLEIDDHVHGNLRITLPTGYVIFSFGFWGESDACIGDWYSVLNELAAMLAGIDDFTYEYPYPDQGDPTLEFSVTPEEVTIRLIHENDEVHSEPKPTTEQTISRNEFDGLVDMAIRLVENTIKRASPIVGPRWLERNKRG
jgi:hypothetical protein